MMRGEWRRYRLEFLFLAITSRERLSSKDTYFLRVWDDGRPGVYGLGEAALFRGLSCDDRPGYEDMLAKVCGDVERYAAEPWLLDEWPSIRMGLETALADLASGGRMLPFGPVEPLRINGLVWMGDEATMARRIDEKLAQGFRCIKIKVGGIDTEREIALVEELRRRAPQVELRLDANGAFTLREALRFMDRVAPLGIHSVEQPVRAGRWADMAELCRVSPVAVALDEELIGLNDDDSRQRMLDVVAPQWVVLKPTLCGGFSGADRWIELASGRGIGWWATSALESSVGLNAIASWLSSRGDAAPMAQGLGTGMLYTNNIVSPLVCEGETLRVNPAGRWQTDGLF